MGGRRAPTPNTGKETRNGPKNMSCCRCCHMNDDDGIIDESSSSRGNKGKVGLLLLLALFTFLSVARVLPMMTNFKYAATISSDRRKATTFADDISWGKASLISKHITTNASSSALVTARATIHKHKYSKQQKQQQLSTNSLPIYLIQSSTNETAQTTWGTLATQWNRTTQYEERGPFCSCHANTLPSII